MKKLLSLTTIFVLIAVFISCDNENDNPYIDTASGIQWTETIQSDLTANEARDFCKSMNENGEIDYELPTIEQLWTLVVNCNDIERCADATDGRYSRLDDSGRLWSQSYKYEQDGVVLKSPVPLELYLDFNKLEEGYENGKYYVRCVRILNGK